MILHEDYKVKMYYIVDATQQWRVLKVTFCYQKTSFRITATSVLLPQLIFKKCYFHHRNILEKL